MDMDSLTLGELRELKALFGGACAPASSPFKVGRAYLIRTVTNYWTGRVASVGDQEIVIEDAAWVADTGRYHQAVADGTLVEVEPVPGAVIIGRGSIVDAVEWHAPLPRDVK